ncbi:hypothetical protein VCHA43P273_80104 [Vibrio chagasii]|nr:hypothetical protein VCHA43P273_80104 [Vibrio chagasii]
MICCTCLYVLTQARFDTYLLTFQLDAFLVYFPSINIYLGILIRSFLLNYYEDCFSSLSSFLAYF